MARRWERGRVSLPDIEGEAGHHRERGGSRCPRQIRPLMSEEGGAIVDILGTGKGGKGARTSRRAHMLGRKGRARRGGGTRGAPPSKRGGCTCLEGKAVRGGEESGRG